MKTMTACLDSKPALYLMGLSVALWFFLALPAWAQPPAPMVAMTLKQVGVTHTKTRTNVYEAGFYHPVNFWFDKEPSKKGVWDYFSPVATPHQPIPYITRKEAMVVVPHPVMAVVPQVIVPASPVAKVYPGVTQPVADY